MSRKKIVPSILSADLTRLAQEVEAAEKGGADWLHVDVMDGHFAPTITIGPLIVSALRKTTKLPLDVHLMIENPDRYIEQFSEAGADIITVPVEACTHLHRTVHFIKDRGCQVGVCLNPATPLSLLDCILPDLDLVILLMVNPGFKGQKLDPALLAKIRALRKLINEGGLQANIEADGGISLDNISQVAGAGADIFVAGTAVFSSKDYGETISKLRNLAESA
ncbi:MAG: ribulose-phosphate 3-epimerase [Nitrospinae bacterium RIFCSPLOWO2_12_FULL_45_22]|nr:MAG: ribulose-phosphate 3-epimerase [Nitrospinae bacterium RIFCSPLOWO2_12_FULL_45_22]